MGPFHHGCPILVGLVPLTWGHHCCHTQLHTCILTHSFSHTISHTNVHTASQAHSYKLRNTDPTQYPFCKYFLKLQCVPHVGFRKTQIQRNVCPRAVYSCTSNICTHSFILQPPHMQEAPVSLHISHGGPGHPFQFQSFHPCRLGW